MLSFQLVKYFCAQRKQANVLELYLTMFGDLMLIMLSITFLRFSLCQVPVSDFGRIRDALHIFGERICPRRKFWCRGLFKLRISSNSYIKKFLVKL